MINVMCLALAIKYRHPEYVGDVTVNSTHYIGVDSGVDLNKKLIDQIAETMVHDRRKHLDQCSDKTVLTFFVNSMSKVTEVQNFSDFANTKRLLLVDNLSLPFIHAQDQEDEE